MKIITWILKEFGGKPPSNLKSFAERLEGVGLKSSWVGKDVLSQPKMEKTLKESAYLFLADSDLSWVGDAVRILRGHSLDLPAISWVYDNLDSDLLRRVTETGVDEVISIAESPSEVRNHLELRTQNVHARVELQKQMRDILVREAKSETILKQREEFLSVCAHDLRSPLGLIQSSLSMLLTGAQGLSQFQSELIERAKRQSEHGIHLVNDLLDVMAYEQGLKPHYDIVDLSKFLGEIHKDYAFQAKEKKITLEYRNPVPDWKVLIDADRMRQVFQNLIVNALKFTPAGKNIHLEVMPFQGRRKTDPPYPMLIVSLRDEGKGIPKDEVEKIFNRFSQVKDYGREAGRGLGLTVAKQISNLHDGNIWVQSVEGQGSTFFVLFPHVLSKPLAKVQEVSGKKMKTVLIAEPSERNREQYFEIIERWGYKPLFVKDGIQAITYAQYYLPDAVILNPSLQKLGELEAALLIRSNSFTKSISLIYAAIGGWGAPKSGEDSPFDSCLRLPFNREAFEIAIEQARTRTRRAPTPSGKPTKKAA